MHVNAQITAAKRAAKDIILTAKSKAGAIREFQALGWKKIGSGAFSVALTHDLYPQTVIKVSADPTERSFRCIKDAFPEYARAILRDWVRSTLAPKIYLSEPVRHNERLTVTVMERCYRIKNREYVHKAERSAANLNSRSGRPIYEDYRLSGHAQRFLENIKQFGDLDIHAGNIMQRRNGSRVFTDPLVIN